MRRPSTDVTRLATFSLPLCGKPQPPLDTPSEELAAVDAQDGARDVSRALRAEEGDGVRHVLRLSHAPERRLGDGLLPDPFGEALDERRAHEAGRDGVDVDAKTPQLGGRRARQRQE